MFFAVSDEKLEYDYDESKVYETPPDDHNSEGDQPGGSSSGHHRTTGVAVDAAANNHRQNYHASSQSSVLQDQEEESGFHCDDARIHGLGLGFRASGECSPGSSGVIGKRTLLETERQSDLEPVLRGNGCVQRAGASSVIHDLLNRKPATGAAESHSQIEPSHDRDAREGEADKWCIGNNNRREYEQGFETSSLTHQVRSLREHQDDAVNDFPSEGQRVEGNERSEVKYPNNGMEINGDDEVDENLPQSDGDEDIDQAQPEETADGMKIESVPYKMCWKVNLGRIGRHCKICNKEFQNSNYLKVHMRVHSGEKPYKCDICNKRFTQASAMYRHKRSHTKRNMNFLSPAAAAGLALSSRGGFYPQPMMAAAMNPMLMNPMYLASLQAARQMSASLAAAQSVSAGGPLSLPSPISSLPLASTLLNSSTQRRSPEVSPTQDLGLSSANAGMNVLTTSTTTESHESSTNAQYGSKISSAISRLRAGGSLETPSAVTDSSSYAEPSQISPILASSKTTQNLAVNTTASPSFDLSRNWVPPAGQVDTQKSPGQTEPVDLSQIAPQYANSYSPYYNQQASAMSPSAYQRWTSRRCKFCNKTFKTTYSLKVHIRIHTGEKPYKCGTCGKRFTQASTAYRHERMHSRDHPPNQEFMSNIIISPTIDEPAISASLRESLAMRLSNAESAKNAYTHDTSPQSSASPDGYFERNSIDYHFEKNDVQSHLPSESRNGSFRNDQEPVAVDSGRVTADQVNIMMPAATTNKFQENLATNASESESERRENVHIPQEETPRQQHKDEFNYEDYYWRTRDGPFGKAKNVAEFVENQLQALEDLDNLDGNRAAENAINSEPDEVQDREKKMEDVSDDDEDPSDGSECHDKVNNNEADIYSKGSSSTSDENSEALSNNSNSNSKTSNNLMAGGYDLDAASLGRSYSPSTFMTPSEQEASVAAASQFANSAGGKYQCNICGKLFTRAHSVIVHQRIHTGERPYRCEICGKTFTQVSCMRRHMQLHSRSLTDGIVDNDLGHSTVTAAELGS